MWGCDVRVIKQDEPGAGREEGTYLGQEYVCPGCDCRDTVISEDVNRLQYTQAWTAYLVCRWCQTCIFL